MSNGLNILQASEDDVSKLLMAESHLGARNCNHQMEQYVFKRRSDGTFIFNIHKMWEKIVLAARIIAAIENPKDVCAISGRPYGQRAVLKFAAHIGSSSIAGRYTPGTFTNQIQKAFQEPRLLVVTDPHVDHQPITEASYVNIPVVAFCNSDSHLKYIDVAIPCNNKGINSVGLIWWMVAREVLRLRGSFPDRQWNIMPDLYFYRDPEEVEKEEAAAALAKEDNTNNWDGVAPADAGMAQQQQLAPATNEEWGAAVPAAAPGVVPVAVGVAPAGGFAQPAGDDWSAQDWGAAPAAGTQDWA